MLNINTQVVKIQQHHFWTFAFEHQIIGAALELVGYEGFEHHIKSKICSNKL